MQFTLDLTQILTLVVGTVLPILVGLVTQKVTSSSVKALLLAGLSALTGLGSELLVAVQSGASYDFGTGIVSAIGVFIVAVALHYGLWKPTGVSEAVQDVGSGRHTA